MHTTATLHQSKIVLYCKFTTAQQANVTVFIYVVLFHVPQMLVQWGHTASLSVWPVR